MSKPIRLTQPMARRLVLGGQGLNGRRPTGRGKARVAETIERLGYVQIDTISVVARAHHHMLWSRCPDYDPEMLHELQAQDRRVFEYWVRAACYVPMSDYRFYLPRMHAVAERKAGWFYNEEAKAVTDHVLERIRAEGPLGSVDFKAPEGKKRGSWWDWKPAKRALEMLFDAGLLMVTERRRFQRIYDVAQRVLPPDVDRSMPSAGEMGRFIVRRVLSAKGFAAARDLRWGWHGSPAAGSALGELVEAGEVVPVRVRGMDGESYAMASAVADARARAGKRQLHILSPFDGAVLDRRRTATLFGFDCKLECYLPEPKRRYGYFCLPVLWGD